MEEKKEIKEDIKEEGEKKTEMSPKPTAYRPGRLSHMEILERIFPLQKKTVLELVLHGCNGDLVKAIEHFLSAQDTIIAQQQRKIDTPSAPKAVSNGKSAFNPPHPTLHSAFSPRAAAFTTEALLARRPHNTRITHNPPAPPMPPPIFAHSIATNPFLFPFARPPSFFHGGLPPLRGGNRTPDSEQDSWNGEQE